MCHEYDRLATRISKGDVAVLQTSDFGLFWHDSCGYKVWPGVRVGQKVPPCIWGECDLHVNLLHVSWIWPTHWRLNDDFDINQRRRRLTRNIRMYVCMGRKGRGAITRRSFPRDDAQVCVSARCNSRAETHPCASSRGNVSRGKDRRVIRPQRKEVDNSREIDSC